MLVPLLNIVSLIDDLDLLPKSNTETIMELKLLIMKTTETIYFVGRWSQTSNRFQSPVFKEESYYENK